MKRKPKYNLVSELAYAKEIFVPKSVEQCSSRVVLILAKPTDTALHVPIRAGRGWRRKSKTIFKAWLDYPGSAYHMLRGWELCPSPSVLLEMAGLDNISTAAMQQELNRRTQSQSQPRAPPRTGGGRQGQGSRDRGQQPQSASQQPPVLYSTAVRDSVEWDPVRDRSYKQHAESFMSRRAAMDWVDRYFKPKGWGFITNLQHYLDEGTEVQLPKEVSDSSKFGRGRHAFSEAMGVELSLEQYALVRSICVSTEERAYIAGLETQYPINIFGYECTNMSHLQFAHREDWGKKQVKELHRDMTRRMSEIRAEFKRRSDQLQKEYEPRRLRIQTVYPELKPPERTLLAFLDPEGDTLGAVGPESPLQEPHVSAGLRELLNTGGLPPDEELD